MPIKPGGPLVRQTLVLPRDRVQTLVEVLDTINDLRPESTRPATLSHVVDAMLSTFAAVWNAGPEADALRAHTLDTIREKIWPGAAPAPAVEEVDDDPYCVCGTARSEHALLGCPEGFQTPESWTHELARIQRDADDWDR